MLSKASAINFASSQPNPSIGPDLTSVFAHLRRQQAELMAYPPAEGYGRLGLVAKSWLEMLEVEPSDLHVLPTTGAQHGLSIAIAAFLETRDTIATGVLCYPGLMAAARLHGVQIAGVVHDEGGLDPNALESLCRHRKIRALYCMPSAANPTGHTMVSSRKEALAAVATKHDLLVIEDETHRPYVERPVAPLLALLPERTVFLTSLSKVLFGGIRVGLAVTNSALGERLRQCLQADVLATSALDLEVVAGLIENGEAARVIACRRAETRRRKAMATRILGDTGSITASAPPRDGPFIWLETPGSLSSESAAALAEARGVSVAPASAFASNGSYRDGLRVALSAPAADAEVERGLKLLRDVLVGGNDRRFSSTWAV
jgi:DNA-binding transcriptional MocR family regulator